MKLDPDHVTVPSGSPAAPESPPARVRPYLTDARLKTAAAKMAYEEALAYERAMVDRRIEELEEEIECQKRSSGLPNKSPRQTLP